MKFVKKQETIEAVKYEIGLEDGFMDMAGESVPYINTTNGFQNLVEDGDYIVTHPDGHIQCVPAEVFESIYVEYREPAECYVIESFGIDEVLCDSSEESKQLIVNTPRNQVIAARLILSLIIMSCIAFMLLTSLHA